MPPDHPLRPRYCETPLTLDMGFPVEPWNAISSGVIVLFGLAALGLVVSRARNDLVLWLMSGLLIVNGVGSVLWHGLRTRWALNLDVIPAIVFLLLLAFIWARRVVPLWQAALAIALLISVPAGLALARASGLALPPGTPVPVFAVQIVLLVGIAVWLILATRRLSPGAAASGLAALTLAGLALTFRSVDPYACLVVPMGSHFLWHVFLSSAAFAGMLTLVQLREATARRP